MSDLQLWSRLKSAKLVTGEVPEDASNEEMNFWYIRALQGFAGWLAALFLIGFLGFGVAGLFEQGAALVLLGLIINGSTYAYFKSNPDSDFFEQMVLAFSLTGQFLFAFGVFELFDLRSKHWLALLAIYQFILMFVMRNYLHRLLSAWFGVIALFWGFDVLVYSGLGAALVSLVFVWIWLNKSGWEAEKNFYEPIGYAMALALLQLHTQNHVWLFGLFRYRTQEVSWLMVNAYWISALLNSAVLIYFVYRMIQEQRINLSSTSGRLIILAGLALLVTAMPVIGLSSAMLVLLVGFARQNKLLTALGGLAMLGFVFWYYASLNTTLLMKSLILMAVGVALLLGYFVAKHFLVKEQLPSREYPNSVEATALSRWQQMAVVFTLVVCLLGVNHAIWQKEQVLKDGQSVFLELAPVDPRSIMQGDFMRLRFAVGNQVRSNTNSTGKTFDERNHDGYFYVKLDERGVGNFFAMADSGIEEMNGLVKMQYRMRNNRVQFATNAFFFQEGDAKLFDAAQFGEFKVADDGELLLKAMYDKDLNLLGENRLD